jgi:hypothetical protein
VRAVNFLHYCSFAIALPFVIVSIIFLLNEYEIIPDGWRTLIGEHSCSISDSLIDVSDETTVKVTRSQTIYLYGPLTVLLLVNVGFYAVTGYSVYKLKRKSGMGINDINYERLTERESKRWVERVLWLQVKC